MICLGWKREVNKMLLRLSMALSLVLLVACEDKNNEVTIVNSQEHVDPV